MPFYIFQQRKGSEPRKTIKAFDELQPAILQRDWWTDKQNRRGDGDYAYRVVKTEGMIEV